MAFFIHLCTIIQLEGDFFLRINSQKWNLWVKGPQLKALESDCPSDMLYPIQTCYINFCSKEKCMNNHLISPYPSQPGALFFETPAVSQEKTVIDTSINISLITYCSSSFLAFAHFSISHLSFPCLILITCLLCTRQWAKPFLSNLNLAETAGVSRPCQYTQFYRQQIRGCAICPSSGSWEVADTWRSTVSVCLGGPAPDCSTHLLYTNICNYFVATAFPSRFLAQVLCLEKPFFAAKQERKNTIC